MLRLIENLFLKTEHEKDRAEEKKTAKEIDMERLKKKKNIKQKSEKRKKIPKTTQETIPYKQFLKGNITKTDNNLFSKTYLFTDINYQIACQEDQEDIFLRWANFLNIFDTMVTIQISIINLKANNEFEEKIIMSLKDDGLDCFREEFNSMLKEKIESGQNDIIRNKYITFTVVADSLDTAVNKFFSIENELTSNFNKIGSKAVELTNNDKTKLLAEIFRGINVSVPDFSKEDFENSREKGYICPDYFEFKGDYFLFDDKFARCIFLRDVPSSLTDEMLADLSNIKLSQVITMNISNVEPHKALNIVKRQITAMETNRREKERKDGYVQDDLYYSLEKARELLEDLRKNNQKMFLMNLIIMHTAYDYEKLQQDTEKIQNTARKHLCNFGYLKFQQEQGMSSALPIGNNTADIISRTLTSESTAVFMPFNSQDLVQDNGFYYGLNAVSGNLILFNRKTLKNPNGFILGSPGSGKSFAAKREMSNVILNTNDDVLVIDPEREYFNLVKELNGEVVNISASSSNYINPLDINANYSDDEDPIVFKSEFIISLCESVISIAGYGLNPKEKTIIDRALKDTYEESGFFNSYSQNEAPTLKDFYNSLLKQPEPVAKDIALCLEIYILGSLKVFSHRTNININNRFICFDIKDLGKPLKTMGMLIVLDAVWNRITKNRLIGKNTWIYMDEIYLLFQNEYSANFLFELYKRARKWGGIPTGITQNVEDLLKSELARRMLSNSDFIQMLNQAPSDRSELAKLLNISESQLPYVTNTESGRGLLFVGNSIIPFVDKFPKNSLYNLMTTRLDEVRI